MGPFISVGHISFMGPFTCMGPFHFRVATLHAYKAFHCHMGPFYPRESPPPVAGFRVVCAGSESNTGP